MYYSEHPLSERRIKNHIDTIYSMLWPKPHSIVQHRRIISIHSIQDKTTMVGRRKSMSHFIQ